MVTPHYKMILAQDSEALPDLYAGIRQLAAGPNLGGYVMGLDPSAEYDSTRLRRNADLANGIDLLDRDCKPGQLYATLFSPAIASKLTPEGRGILFGYSPSDN
jgi:hypothetical protein